MKNRKVRDTGITFEVTGDRSVKRGGYQEAELLGLPVDRGVGPYLSSHFSSSALPFGVMT